MAGIQTGHGATITFGTSSFTGSITAIGGFTTTREALDTSHLGTSTYRTFTPGDLIDAGEFEVTLLYDADEQPPISGAAETVTITLPDSNPASGGGATIAGSAFVTQFTTPEIATDQLLTASFTVKWAGTITYSDET